MHPTPPCYQIFCMKQYLSLRACSPPSRDILADPQLQVYVQDFGKQTGDFGLFAEVEGVIAGAVWGRIMEDYGHIDNETPSLAIALYKEYRGKGVGTALLQAMLKLLQEHGYEQVSLAVQKENYAVKLYTACGFRVYRESEEEYIMVRSLRQNTACMSQEGAL